MSDDKIIEFPLSRQKSAKAIRVEFAEMLNDVYDTVFRENVRIADFEHLFKPAKLLLGMGLPIRKDTLQGIQQILARFAELTSEYCQKKITEIFLFVEQHMEHIQLGSHITR
jgi:hypothetical protein